MSWSALQANLIPWFGGRKKKSMCGLLPTLKMPLEYAILAPKREGKKKKNHLKSQKEKKNSMELDSNYSVYVR